MAEKTKVAKVIEMLDGEEVLSQKEIAERAGCSEGYITATKKRLAAKRESGDITDKEQAYDKEINEGVDSFINRVKIRPDPDTLTKNEEPEDEMETYQCGNCGHTWQGEKTQHQAECPGCGCDLS